MRGFMLSSVYFITFLLATAIAFSVVGGFDIPDHSGPQIDIVALSAESVFGFNVPCYYDINTFDELNMLALPEVVYC